MLAAMSAGGRIGFDAPFMPRTCDMRWFTSEEVCQILGRFDRVLLVGDSMLRHIIGGINILIRKDIGYGAVTDWNFSAQEKYVFQSNPSASTDEALGRTAFVINNLTLRPAPFKVSTRPSTSWQMILEVFFAPIESTWLVCTALIIK
jgi:hypothetical protein